MKSGSERLRLFDPAARAERFDPVTSDFDFVVRFADKSPGYASRYLDFAEALEELFGREVDLVTERSVPASALSTRRRIRAATRI
jgi:predicted nucleotidyltransferase